MTKINIIDIGAIGGFDIPWKRHQDKLEWSLSFEPNDTPILTGKQLRYDCAVWNFDGEANFYVSGPNGTGSSLLKQNYDWVKNNFEKIKSEGNERLNKSWFERSQITKEFKCPVKKLDSILAELYHQLNHKIPFHFLKSDTQSGEFFVLEGARNYLEEDCLGLELELFRYPLYEGVILEDEVKNYLNQLGFSVAGRTPYQNSFSSQADYLFLRQNPRTSEEKEIINLILSIYQPQGEEKLIKQVSWSGRLFNKSKMMLKKLINFQ
jgi:FkbM family methyltransferase